MRGLLQRTVQLEDATPRPFRDAARAWVATHGAEIFPKPSEIGRDLIELLKGEDVKTVKRIAATITIGGDALAALVFYAPALGYRYARFGYDRRPEHLRLRPEERDALFYAEKRTPDLIAKAFGRMRQLSKERRMYVAHVFANDARWHVFSFANSDTATPAHWKHGPHVHYISSVLQPRLTLDQVIDELQKVEGEVHGEHIRAQIDGARKRRAP